MGHYYDVYSLLQEPTVLPFIGTPDYQAHKRKRFRSEDNPTISENEAFLLNDAATRSTYEDAYRASHDLYHKNQPDFGDILGIIHEFADRL